MLEVVLEGEPGGAHLGQNGLDGVEGCVDHARVQPRSGVLRENVIKSC